MEETSVIPEASVENTREHSRKVKDRLVKKKKMIDFLTKGPILYLVFCPRTLS